ncbi:hypothetical protein P3F01_15790 [Clostridium perfringens]|nr:hypothetical protein [Clostridium perfringens]MDT9337821.1 hypothetical protein [Clostridium perfringens]MDT9345578.1 hypothetical protein [Clostridium perfringens]MDT9347012.1 hypothetical protein [Clostridium perfringens]MDT9354664.1 hypothetical protein [Clostridium perfringens]
MNKKKIEILIPKLKQIRSKDDLELIQNAVDSCLTVQMLRDISRKKVI